MDLVDEEDRAGEGLDLLDDLLEPLLEVAAIARAGEQRAHVEGEDGRPAQHAGHVALGDAASEALGDGRLADAGVADEQRVVLLAAAQHLDSAGDLDVPPDQGVDLALARLLVQVDAIGVERILLLLAALLGALRGLWRVALPFVGAARRLCFGHARPLGDAMRDVVDGIVARHVLLLQEIGGMALALGENRDEHVRAGHLLAAGRLHVDDRALDDALEAGRGLGILAAVGNEVLELGVDIFDEVAPQHVEVDVAGPHHGRGVLVLDEREEQMLERRVLMAPLVGGGQGAMEGLLEAA